MGSHLSRAGAAAAGTQQDSGGREMICFRAWGAGPRRSCGRAAFAGKSGGKGGRSLGHPGIPGASMKWGRRAALPFFAMRFAGGGRPGRGGSSRPPAKIRGASVGRWSREDRPRAVHYGPSNRGLLHRDFWKPAKKVCSTPGKQSRW